MQKFPRRWDDITKINYLQRKILLCSIGYYEFNHSFITDREYDKLSKQLVSMQAKYDNIYDTQYGYIYYDFDGSTGFDLYHRLNDKDRNYLLKIYSMMISGVPSIKKKGKLF